MKRQGLLYSNQSPIRNHKEFLSRNYTNQRTSHRKKNKLEASPSLETAKAILNRANGLLQATRTRLSKLPSRTPSDTHEDDNKDVLKITQNHMIISIEDIINGLELCEFLHIFLKNKIHAKDLLLLSKDDIKEMALPIYARNRILAFQNYFKDNKDIHIVPGELFKNLLKQIYNPSLIDALGKSHKESVIAKIGGELERSIKENVEVNVERLGKDVVNDTPSFSSRVEFRFDEESVNKRVLSEITDIQNELRDLHKEYNKKTWSNIKSKYKQVCIN